MAITAFAPVTAPIRVSEEEAVRLALQVLEDPRAWTRLGDPARARAARIKAVRLLRESLETV
jgi:hypothetical protein